MRRIALIAIGAVIATSLVATVINPALFKEVHRLPGGDALGHFAIMGTLALLVCLAFADAAIRGRRLGLPGCLALLTLAVTADELAQLWLPARTFDPTDLVANYLGLALGGLGAWAILRHHRATDTPDTPDTSDTPE